MNALKHRLHPLRAVSGVLLSVALLAVSAPTLLADNPARPLACQASGHCGG
jgi:hypothetical protein